MLLSARAEVRWPDLAEIDAAWTRDVVGELHLLRAAADGRLTVDVPDAPDGAPTEEDVPFRLLSGTHLAPGATYRAEEQGLDLDVVVEIDGAPGSRTVTAR